MEFVAELIPAWRQEYPQCYLTEPVPAVHLMIPRSVSDIAMANFRF